MRPNSKLVLVAALATLPTAATWLAVVRPLQREAAETRARLRAAEDELAWRRTVADRLGALREQKLELERAFEASGLLAGPDRE